MRDTWHGLRILLQNPGFAGAAVTCLALGMGATTAIFSVVHAVLLRPLPYRQPERLVRIYTEFPDFPGGGLRRFWVSEPEYLDLKREARAWESLEGWNTGGVNVAGGAEPVRVTAAYVTGGLLRSLGVAPLMGRLLDARDDAPGAPLVAAISYGLWQRAYGGDAGIVGRDIRSDGVRCTVVAVMPKGFAFPPGEVDAAEVWFPLQLDPLKPQSRAKHYLALLGRLGPGTGLRKAQDELAGLVAHWGETAAPNTHTLRPKSHPIVSFPFHDEVVGSVRPAMLMLLGAVGFVLLIACVNVANLLLVRAEARQREIAIRIAMGAGMGRLLRQFVTEGAVLSLAGAALGVLLAWGGVRAIAATNPGSIPRAGEIGIDGTVLCFTLAVSLATGVFFGLSPLAHFTRGNLSGALKAGGRSTPGSGARILRRVLVTAELGLALVLLIGCGLMVRTFWKLRQVDTGINPRGVLTMQLSLAEASYPNTKSLLTFWTRAQERLAGIPGVTGVSVAVGLPPQRPIQANGTQIEGFVKTPGGPVEVVDYWQIVGRRYFKTLGVRLIEGRLFDERDGPDAPLVTIVNQSMARHFWGSQSPLGRRVRPGQRMPWFTVVGVVADVKNAGVDKPAGTELYFSYEQLQAGTPRSAWVFVKTAGDPMRFARAARAKIAEVDNAMPVARVRAMDDVVAAAEARPRFLTLLLTLFSVVALALAAVGIYGVISYSVARRTAEIAIRMAMGAQPADVLRMVLAQGARLGACGVALGLAGALALTGLIRGLLFGVSSFDPGTFAAMAALLGAVTLLACYVPARRAAKVDPMVALRYE